ncbi:MAG: PASTA domain-containing protein [Clostridia bacterium]|nr:PASTA domain-containing protein [Clostridia bacterium]
MFTVIVVLLLALIIKVAYWQLVRGEDMRAAVERQQTGSTNVIAARGTIYDRNGKALAESATVNTLICNPQDVDKDSQEHKEAEFIAEKLSVILDMDYDRIYSLLTKDNRYQVIKKRLTVEETEQIKALKNKENNEDTAKIFKAVTFEEDSKRYYSYNVAPSILGFTGYDNNGMQGIELTFDNELTGSAGSVKTAQSASGTTLEDQQYEAYSGAAKGADVVLTIDETIQHYLEKHLETAVKDSELKEGAAGIVMNPKTGEILAMSTKPDFDANNPYDVTQFEKYSVDFEYHSDLLDRDMTARDQEKLFSTGDTKKAASRSSSSEDENEDTEELDTSLLTEERKEELLSERNTAMRNKMWRNKAISDAYEPGSTFKIITAAAALEEKVVNLETPFVCGGVKKLGGHDIHCHVSSGHGAQNFLEGVKHSCNVVFMETGLKIGSDKFKEYFDAFGLTRKTNIELVGETRSIFYDKEKLSDTDIATSSFGQGFNITPIQLITAVSAVVNGGNLMKPQIVKEIRNDAGIIKSYQPEIVNKVISEETSAVMRNILEQVVSAPDGTGKNAYISGYRIGGKTGTSQKGDRSGTKRIASFIGFAPADDPQIVCLVMLDEPQVANKFGGTIAAPVAGAVIEDTLEYLGVERQYGDNESAAKFAVPDVRDLDLSDAKEELSSAGFRVKVSGKGAKIVDQLPKPGLQLSKDSIVLLYTDENVEAKLVKVPDLTGTRISDARDILQGCGLNFETIGAGQNSTGGAYAVKQSIEAGSEVPPATVVGVEFRHSASD